MANKKSDEPAQDGQQAPEDTTQQKTVSVEVDGKQIIAASASEQVKAKRLDYAPNGGRYLVNGVLVDANGQQVKE